MVYYTDYSVCVSILAHAICLTIYKKTYTLKCGWWQCEANNAEKQHKGQASERPQQVTAADVRLIGQHLRPQGNPLEAEQAQKTLR